MDQLQDSFGRQITYLRLSVTDRCSFRCVYCLPPEGIPLLRQQEYLTPDQMENFVKMVALMGVWRLRLTGGEPLQREDIVSLVARFSAIPGIRDLALTTNGERLSELAAPLKEAGLNRVNISFDSLEPERFRKITGSGSFFKVWSGVLRALEAGLQVKINVVLLNGMSEGEIDRFAALAYGLPLEVRFIEFMPLCGTAWKKEMVLPIKTVRDRIALRYRLTPLSRGTEVAESFSMDGGKGKIGFIGSMTEPFCSKCSRIRMSATGKIQLCLFSNAQINFRPLLEEEVSPEERAREIRRIVMGKPAEHPWVGGRAKPDPRENAPIRSIGG